MKPKGKPHPHNALTDRKARQIKGPGRYADGQGLYLLVEESGARRWLLRTSVHGRRVDMGLGGFPLVGLADARQRALHYRRIARGGGDPIAEKRKAETPIPSFAEAARSVHAERTKTWKNAKHQNQWINTLAQYVFPALGERRLDHIETPDIRKVLSPIWLTKPETARRVKQRIGIVMDWSKASGFRSGENPVDGVSLGLPDQTDRKKHHAALPYPELPEFIGKLRASGLGEVTKLAFELLVLTAARTGEVLGARWEEFDLENAIWTIPAERMKAGQKHRVPLARRCIQLLRRAKQLSANSDLVFPGRSSTKPISNMVFLMALRRMGLQVTAHGFRSAFRDWAAEQTHFAREVCEKALAHTIKDKTEAAYQRGDLLDRRRELMDAWANYLASKSKKPARAAKKRRRP
jgi:integrase